MTQADSRADTRASASDQPLEDVPGDALDAAEGQDEVSVGDLLDAFGSRSFGPVPVLFGLLALFPPIGAVPGAPIVPGAVLHAFLMIPLKSVNLVVIPGVALTAFGVGLMARDGLFMLIAFAATAGAAAALFWVPWGSLFGWLS